jgi:hypothetical protein
MKSVRWLLWVSGVVGLVGCGHSTTTAPPAATDGKPVASTTAPPGNGPDRAVYDFLEAVRTGNDEKAAKMLTPLAREKVAEQHMVVAPPGSDTARFEVGQVQTLGDDGARVSIKWTDLDETGKPHSDEVLWMVRRVDEGWRIAGVAAPVFEGEPPLLLNFEDPADMLAKQKLVREEIKRRADQAAAQTTPHVAQATGATASPSSAASTTPAQRPGAPATAQAQGVAQSPQATSPAATRSPGAADPTAAAAEQAAKVENSLRR